MERFRGRIGLVVPASNTNLEPDFALLAPKGITLHFTRIGGYDVDAIPDTAEMRRFAAQGLSESVELLMAAAVNVIAYGCTSATLSSGPEFDRAFAAGITQQAGIPAVTAAGALIEALAALGVQRVAFTSPYTPDLNAEAIRFLQICGLSVLNCAEVGRLNSREQGELTPAQAYDLGRKADHPQAEALVMSCTDFRAVEVLADLERDLGKPVVTSNQALMFASLRRLGVDASTVPAGGRLFSLRCLSPG